MPPPRPSSATPKGRPSSARRPRSTATSALTSADKRRTTKLGVTSKPSAATWDGGPTARQPRRADQETTMNPAPLSASAQPPNDSASRHNANRGTGRDNELG